MKRSELAWNGLAVVVETGTTATAVENSHVMMTNAGTSTLTLPAAPRKGARVVVEFTNGLYDNVIARNSKLLVGATSDLTVDVTPAIVNLRYIDNTYGWRLL